MADRRPRVMFLWPEVSGYMAACWRALRDLQQVDLQLIAYGDSRKTAFGSGIMVGLNWHALPMEFREDISRIASLCDAYAPDVLVVPGWMNRAYRKVAARMSRRGIPIVLTMDTPWMGRPRQYLARYLLHGYLRHVSHAFVPGERAYQYAIRLGFDECEITRALYGHDDESFGQCFHSRSEWPHAFVCVGRYERDKGFDLLMAAYQKYRGRVSVPWRLVCCGMGSLKSLSNGIDGVDDLGFVQPSDLPRVLQKASSFVLASRHESWGVALAEGCSGGLPVITTNGVGASVELVRDGYNGFIAPSGDVDGLAAALCAMHECDERRIAEMGRRSMELAAPYGAREWGRRVVGLIFRVMQH